MKIEVKRTEPTRQRPHGLSYSLTLHDPEGVRLLGFDNAHAAPPLGGRYKAKPEAHDHWHRTEMDKGRAYVFRSALHWSRTSWARWSVSWESAASQR